MDLFPQMATLGKLIGPKALDGKGADAATPSTDGASLSFPSMLNQQQVAAKDSEVSLGVVDEKAAADTEAAVVTDDLETLSGDLAALLGLVSVQVKGPQADATGTPSEPGVAGKELPNPELAQSTAELTAATKNPAAEVTVPSLKGQGPTYGQASGITPEAKTPQLTADLIPTANPIGNPTANPTANPTVNPTANPEAPTLQQQLGTAGTTNVATSTPEPAQVETATSAGNGLPSDQKVTNPIGASATQSKASQIPVPATETVDTPKVDLETTQVPGAIKESNPVDANAAAPNTQTAEPMPEIENTKADLVQTPVNPTQQETAPVSAESTAAPTLSAGQSAAAKMFTAPTGSNGITSEFSSSSTSAQLGSGTSSLTQDNSIQSQVAQKIAADLPGVQGTEKMTLQLNPENLGRVDIQFIGRDDQLSIVITASGQDAEQVLREGVKELAEGIVDRSGRWQQVDIKVEQKESESRRQDRNQDDRQQGRGRNREHGEKRDRDHEQREAALNWAESRMGV